MLKILDGDDRSEEGIHFVRFHQSKNLDFKFIRRIKALSKSTYKIQGVAKISVKGISGYALEDLPKAFAGIGLLCTTCRRKLLREVFYGQPEYMRQGSAREKHRAGKSRTHCIESFNANTKHSPTRLRRKSAAAAVQKCAEMAVMSPNLLFDKDKTVSRLF